MSNYVVSDSSLTSIANAIRTKGETSESLEYPDGFVEAIGDIQTGSEEEPLTVTANGTYTAPTGKAYSPITVNVPKYPVRIVDSVDEHGGTVRNISVIDAVVFIDYDGTIVDTKSIAEINAMSSDSDLPANPTHTGLTAQGWNWTVAQLKAQLTAMPDQTVYVGQMYVTTSGSTEIDVEMREGRLSPTLTICVKGTVSVDWGDGTTADTVTGTSLTTRKAASHTYSSAGNYTITVTETSGSEYAFYGSSSYTIIRKNTSLSENHTYTSCVKKIRLGSGIKSISNFAFAYCRHLSSITIPSGVTISGNNQFQYCASLISVTIPSGITSIMECMFQYCSSLQSISIPSSVTSIGPGAFSSCYSLASVIIPSGVTSIGGSAFAICSAFVSVTIPNSVTSIGDNAFYNCSSLTSITIPSGVTSIENYTFQSCFSLTNVTIPSSVASIGECAFQYCYALVSITIPSGVTSIGNYAFQYCSSLASITIPSSVTSIGNYVFQNCSSLTSVTIPSGVTSIGISVFSYCYSLANITIPSDVASIGNSAFYSCYGVSEYHVMPTSPPTLGTTVFNNIVSDCVIYVPRGKLSTYQTATGWANYVEYIQEEPAS